MAIRLNENKELVAQIKEGLAGLFNLEANKKLQDLLEDCNNKPVLLTSSGHINVYTYCIKNVKILETDIHYTIFKISN